MNDLEPCYQLARKEDKDFEKLTKVNFSSSILSSLIWLIFPVLIIVLVPVFKKNVEISEFWTRTFSRAYVTVASFFSNLFPLSFTEIFFISLLVIVIIAIISIIKLFIRKKWISANKKVVSLALVVTSIIATYNLSCSFAYTRKPLEIPYYTAQVDNSEFKDIYNYFASDLNYCATQLEFESSGDVKRPMNIYGLSKLINNEYSILDGNDYFFRHTSLVKPMMSSFIYRELQITGLTFNPFGEANVNVLATTMELPITIAHELAHTKGVMREDEANQLAFYVCLNSGNPYLRFSAYCLYFTQLSVMTNSVYMSKEDRGQLVSLNEHFYTCRNYAAQYWKKHDLLGKIGDWLNNLYIKSSGIDSGTDSYSGGTDSSPKPDETDPTIIRLVSSKYQQLFFDKYYRMKGE